MNIIVSHIKAGFANQLFQFATGYAAAKRIGAKFKLDTTFFDTSDEFTFKLGNLNIDFELANENEINELKNIPNAPFFFKALAKLGITNKYFKSSHIEEVFGFSPDKRILEISNSAYIYGWCTVLDYFNEYKKDFLKLFSPKTPFSQQASFYLEQIKNSNSVSIHIRRGDYVTLEDFFRVMPVSYYKEATEKILEMEVEPQFFVFSNDLNWAKENLTFLNNAIFVDLNYNKSYTGKADIEEFFLMKECKHNIIANSSFSWWPAYLNENNQKVVITPKVWFNNKMYQESFSNHPLQEKSWISI
jgi:hypothetical protein